MPKCKQRSCAVYFYVFIFKCNNIGREDYVTQAGFQCLQANMLKPRSFKCITTHLLRLIQTTLLPLSLLMAVDVIFKRGLVHVVADHRAEGADAVTLLVLIQFVLGDAGEALAAVTTHQRLLVLWSYGFINVG